MEKIHRAKAILGTDMSKEYIKLSQKMAKIRKLRKQRMLLKKQKMRNEKGRSENLIKIIDHTKKSQNSKELKKDNQKQKKTKKIEESLETEEPEDERDTELIKNMNSGKWSMILNFSKNIVRFGKQPKRLKHFERAITIDELEDYETDFQPDFDYVADEWGIDFLEEISPKLEQKILKLKEIYLKKYLLFVQCFNKAIKLSIHQEKFDKIIYKSK